MEGEDGTHPQPSGASTFTVFLPRQPFHLARGSRVCTCPPWREEPSGGQSMCSSFAVTSCHRGARLPRLCGSWLAGASQPSTVLPTFRKACDTPWVSEAANLPPDLPVLSSFWEQWKKRAFSISPRKMLLPGLSSVPVRGGVGSGQVPRVAAARVPLPGHGAPPGEGSYPR